MKKSIELLQKVLNYYEGKEEYDFSGLDENDRNNEAFDAWIKISQEIKSYLSDYNQVKEIHRRLRG